MKKTAVQILSIHDNDGTVLSFDLKEILRVLSPYLDQWIWCVTWLDAHGGPRLEETCAAVEATRPAGKWLTSRELVELGNEVLQTVEGTFLAFPKTVNRQTVEPDDLDLGQFPVSRAELALTAVDGGFFELYVKDPAIAELVRHRFRDVREEDPATFFGESQ